MSEDTRPAVTVSLAESILKKAGELGMPMSELRAALLAEAGDNAENQYHVNWVVRNMIRTGKARFGNEANLVLPAFLELAQIP